MCCLRISQGLCAMLTAIRTTVVLALIGATFSLGVFAAEDASRSPPRLEASFYIVSMYRVIANPETFSGKRILLSGCFVISDRSQILYANETTYRYGYIVDGISLNLTSGQVVAAKKLDGYWGFIEGTFSAIDMDGQMRFAGVLDKVTRFKKMGERCRG